MARGRAADRRGVDARYFADVQGAYRRLVDAGYLAEKGRIMGAIERFIALVEARTLREVRARARRQPHARRSIQIAILALIVLVGAAAPWCCSRASRCARSAG